MSKAIFGNAIGVQSVVPEHVEAWLDSKEAAEFLRVSPAMLRNLTCNGKVPFYKFGRRNRYLKQELVAMILKQPRGDRHGS